MAKATITVELDEEDRKRLDDGIAALRELVPLLKRQPYPGSLPIFPNSPWPSHPTVGDFPPFSPVWSDTRSGTYVADSKGQTTYNS